MSVAATATDPLAEARARSAAGNLAEAERICRQALAEKPGQPALLFELGRACQESGRSAEALAHYRQALALAPDMAAAHYHAGHILQHGGELEQAWAHYDRAVALQPALPEAHFNRAAILESLGRHDEAVACFAEALRHRPGFMLAAYNIGIIRMAQGKLGEAAEWFHRVIEETSGHPHAAYWRAVCLLPAEPVAQAAAAQPGSGAAQYALGERLQDIGVLDQAMACYDRALALGFDTARLHAKRAAILADHDRLDEALAACQAAIARDPGEPQALHTLGAVRLGRREVAPAIEALEACARSWPGTPETETLLARAYLLGGDVVRGFAMMESRLRIEGLHAVGAAIDPARGGPPQWDGADLAGRTILLHGEQGFGDALQFVRFVPEVARRGGRVVLAVAPALVPLFAENGLAEVVALGSGLPSFDVHCSLMSLPSVLGTTLDTLPARPYLAASPVRRAEWRRRLGGGGPRLGLVWSSGQHTLTPGRVIAHAQRKSLDLAAFQPILALPGLRVASLQVGAPAAQARDFPAVLDLTADLRDFAETAAAIAELDLVVTVDTAVAHLAGALGAPTWTLLPYDACWRWLLDRGDSPWYPSMRLFRQPQPGDWASVLAELRAALAVWMAERG